MSSHVHNASGGTTEHEAEIAALREEAFLLQSLTPTPRSPEDDDLVLRVCALMTAAALLEVHDASGISLDDWIGPRQLVEHFIGDAFLENGV